MKKVISKKHYIAFTCLCLVIMIIAFLMLYLGKEVSEYFYIGFVVLIFGNLFLIFLFYNKLIEYEKNQKIKKLKNIIKYESENTFDIYRFIENVKLNLILVDDKELNYYKYKKDLIIILELNQIDNLRKIVDTYYDNYNLSNKNGEIIYAVILADEPFSLDIIKNLTIEYKKKSIMIQKDEIHFDDSYTDPSAPRLYPFLYDVTTKKLKGYYIKGIQGKTMKNLIKYDYKFNKLTNKKIDKRV